MKDSPSPSSQLMRIPALVAISILFIGSLTFISRAMAQVTDDFSNPEERELYETVPGQGKNKNILDATNPMDILNQLRRATAMDNATTPSDAIDAALKALEADSAVSAEPLNY